MMTVKDYLEITKNNVILLLIDLQSSIVSATTDSKQVIEKTSLLIRAAKELEIPIITTEQYPRGLGKIDPRIDSLLPKDVAVLEKVEFNCFDNETFSSKLNKYKFKKKYIIIAGVEAHICIFQTAIASEESKFKPIVIADAISSRKSSDYEIAISMYKLFKIPVLSTEMLIYLLLKKAATPEFKTLLTYLK